MYTISIISQKGGAGKTTLAIHLAVAAEQAGLAAVIIDLDPQASATNWKDSRSDETPIVVSAQSARLTTVLATAKEKDAQFVIIDTAPHSESAALAAARAADFILIPCRPAILDLRAISNTIDLVRIADKPAAVVLNSVPSRSSLAREAIDAVKNYNIDIAPIQVGQRAIFIHALTIGQTAQEHEPSGKAAAEIQQLFMYTIQQLNNNT